MRVLLDESLCDVQVGTVGEALAAAAAIAEGHGRLIVDVIVDGTRLAEPQLDDPTTAAMPAEEICMQSATPVGLAMQLLDDMHSSLDDLDDLHQSAAEHLQADARTTGLEELGNAIAIWMNLRRAIELASRVLDFKPHEDLDSAALELTQQLQGLQQSLEADDIIALADTLLYDLPPVVDHWRTQLGELRTRLNDETGAQR